MASVTLYATPASAQTLEDLQSRLFDHPSLTAMRQNSPVSSIN